LLGRFNSACQHFSFTHESLAPQVEKLLRPFETNISINQLVAFLCLMNAVEGVSVPKSNRSALRVLHKLCKNSSSFRKTSLQVGHLLSSAIDFKKGILSLSALVFL
jgi:hypothetical protein